MRHFFQKFDNSAPAGTFQTISQVHASSMSPAEKKRK
jgi:hypothetical protein